MTSKDIDRYEVGALGVNLLRPLLSMRPVALRAYQLSLRKRGKKDAIILLVPSESVNFHEGGDSPGLFVGVEGGGFELFDAQDMKVARLYKIGLSMASARVLRKTVQTLFNQE